MRFAWVDASGAMRFANRPEFSSLVAAGEISSETLVADTLVQTKAQLSEKWLTPFGKSWHKRIA